MNSLSPILALWHTLRDAETDCVLATIISVEGPSYRKPGARMLVSADGRRAGTISGGCLEEELARRAFWLTERGPTISEFSTVGDDGDRPYGSGCGGILHLLLERRATAAPLLEALDFAYQHRLPLGIATILQGPRIAQRAVSLAEAEISLFPADTPADVASKLRTLAIHAHDQASAETSISTTAETIAVEHLPARTGLWIFGAGNDAQPLQRMATELGWFTAILDGRSHLATRERFPAADVVHAIDTPKLPQQLVSIEGELNLTIRPTDAVAIMTHSFEQDARLLAWLHSPDAASPAYLGVLGPQRRTSELLEEAAKLLAESAQRNSAITPEPQLADRLASLHSPMGLDLGATNSAAIALSILSEIETVLHHASARALRELRTMPKPQQTN